MPSSVYITLLRVPGDSSYLKDNKQFPLFFVSALYSERTQCHKDILTFQHSRLAIEKLNASCSLYLLIYIQTFYKRTTAFTERHSKKGRSLKNASLVSESLDMFRVKLEVLRYAKSIYLSNLEYFTNLDFPEIRGFPFLSYLLG